MAYLCNIIYECMVLELYIPYEVCITQSFTMLS
jgi:hypothetical protein